MSVKPVNVLYVSPSLPDKLKPALEIAMNMRWCWSHEATDLFRRLDRELWDKVNKNPVFMLGQIKQERLNEILDDDAIMAHLDRVYEDLQEYLNDKKTWYDEEIKPKHILKVAYFSLEFGLNETIPIYSGGLGMLAGDHLKSASDLGIPLTGVGLLYQEGYFRQYLNADGWQQEEYIGNDFYNMPIEQVRGEDGNQLSVTVEYPTGPVKAMIWKVTVGRITLYLLDTNTQDNSPEDRDITSALYGGGLDMRIRQEMLLGIGGVRLLKALDINPNVYHMNEGHSAFLALERSRQYMERQGLSFWEGHSLVRSSNVFTTHTPVPAGNDVFPPDMVLNYFSPYLDQYGLSPKDFLGLGRQNPADDNEGFCMTVLAIKEAAFINGVSRLHGEVSRKMWRNIWESVPLEEIPIDHVTNGVHLTSWVSKEMSDLLSRYLGPRWMRDPSNVELWERIEKMPAEELWQTHERRRERLVAFARRRLAEQFRSRGAAEVDVRRAEEVLNPEALTIGFARRFATYKRGTLLFKNLERLVNIIDNKDRPVQIIFAGKAHPRDNSGKELIRQIVHFGRKPRLRSHIVFMENYDMHLARYMLQGVDVWLNTPRRPLEASGTSGMKASANGVINLSILDGWWCEAFESNSNVGWAIGHGEEYEDTEYQDDIEADSLYDLLEKEVVPLFYDRGSDNLPRGWIKYMKENMHEICPQFNTNRMVKEYTKKAYAPCMERHNFMSLEDCEEAKIFTDWKQYVRRVWKDVRITNIDCSSCDNAKVGEEIVIQAAINMAGLTPEDVVVQIVHGPLDSGGGIIEPEAVEMAPVVTNSDGDMLFKGSFVLTSSGRRGQTVRVMPRNPMLDDPFKMGLIKWGA